MNIGGDDNFVLFDEEPRGLQPDQQILFRCDFRLGLPHFRTQSHRPGPDLPARQAFGQLEIDLSQACFVGGDRSRPECGVRKVGSNGRLLHLATARFAARSGIQLSLTLGQGHRRTESHDRP